MSFGRQNTCKPHRTREFGEGVIAAGHHQVGDSVVTSVRGGIDQETVGGVRRLWYETHRPVTLGEGREVLGHLAPLNGERDRPLLGEARQPAQDPRHGPEVELGSPGEVVAIDDRCEPAVVLLMASPICLDARAMSPGVTILTLIRMFVTVHACNQY